MELGDDLGHLTSFYPLIIHLCSKGFIPYCIVKNLQKTTDFNWPEQVVFLQAPIYLSAQPSTPVYSFSDILLYKGYKSINDITCMASAWNKLYKLIKPACVIFDHSPTALLALKQYQLPKFIYSNSFLTMPVDSPYLNLRSGSILPTDDSLNTSQQVINIINQYLINHQEDTINNIGELYQASQTVLIGYKELDIYRAYRKNECYISSLNADFGFDNQVISTDPNDFYVFSYIKHKAPHSEIAIKTLKELNIKGICYYAGISKEQAKELSTENFLITNKPISIHKIIHQVKAIICHAGKGLVNNAIGYGLPMILMPTQLEQRWTTKTLEKKQCAVGIYREDDDSFAVEKIKKFFSNNHYEDYAKSLALELQENNQTIDISTFVEKILLAIESYSTSSINH